MKPQIPPIAASSIFAAMLNNYVLGRPSSLLTPEERGCDFFKTLKLFRLDQQQRSVDPVQTANIHKMRVLDPNACPITPEIISTYNMISENDIVIQPRWEINPIVIQMNTIRHEINRIRVLRFAHLVASPILMWRNFLCGKQAGCLTAEERELLYATHQALTGKFVPGCPCSCLDNVNPKKGISNGARNRMHSLILDPREDEQSLLKKIERASPAEIIMLDYPPVAIVVELLDADLTKYSAGDSLVPGKAVVPLYARSRSRYEPIKSFESVTRFTPIDGVRYRSIGCEPEFAITFEKSQARTLDGVILDLNQWPGMHLSFEKIYVALTRVRTMHDVRLMPLHCGQSFDHLFRLKPDPRMLAWLAGFGPDGIWDADLCKKAIERFPADCFKKKRNPRSSQPKTNSSAPDENAPSARSDNASDGTNQSGNGQGQNRTGTNRRQDSAKSSGVARDQITARFRLDLPIPRCRQTDFKSYHVAGDGDCLFTSVKKLLSLQISVSELRTQVVEHMDTLSLERRMTIVNEHLLRDPAWTNARVIGPINIFDSQGNATPLLESDGRQVIRDILLDHNNHNDISGQRFVRLWTRYRNEMLLHAWGGNAEISAISQLYSVNVIIWRVAEQSNERGVINNIARIEVPVIHGSPNLRTLHLRWVNEKHYEFTDIPPSYQPHPASDQRSEQSVQMPRTSGRVRRPRELHDV